ncbi:MAG: sugar isomerase [Bryobacteraceae bacterium]
MCCHHLNRREFVGVAAAGANAAALFASSAPAWKPDWWDPSRPLVNPGKPLKVQPVLMYHVSQRREETSWKSWGGVQSHESAQQEASRIEAEWKALSARSDFPIEPLPVAKVTLPEEAPANAGADVTVVYPATGSGKLMHALIPEKSRALLFVRRRSGPVSYWYEALSTRQLRPEGMPLKAGDPRRLSVNDVVVDDQDELLWRLRALYGVKNFLGARIVALGGARGKYAAEAPQVARERYRLDIVETSYDDLGKRIESALKEPTRMQQAERWAGRYLAMPNTALETERSFVVNAFALYGLFKEMMLEHEAFAFTINQCMNTIMPMAKTTACLTLELLNDEGLMAFCESDFVIIPAGMLLRHIAARPVFLHNSTFPHKGVVTCAHCTGPRRMDGDRYEPVRILTHYESEYGAAPKVEMPLGQMVTCISPQYATARWMGIRGVVEDNPFYEVCRSQQDVRILGQWRKLLNEVRDSHWVMAYGDFVKELAYAAPEIGVTLDTLEEAS